MVHKRGAWLVYLSRVWTVFEQFTSLKLGIPVTMILPRAENKSLVNELAKGNSGFERVHRAAYLVIWRE